MGFRFLFCPWASRGELGPLLAVAVELRGRGHFVAFCSTPRIRRTIEAQGFASLPSPAEPPPRFPGSDRKSGAAHYLIAPLRAQLTALEEALRWSGPDVVVDGILPFAPRLAAERHGLLHASICTTACPLPSVDLFPFGMAMPPARDRLTRALARAARERQRADLAEETAEWNAVRRALGLPEGEEHPWTSLPSRHLVLLGTTPELEHARPDLPDHVHFVGPLLWRDGDEPPLPARLRRLAAEMPVVYVSQGSFFTADFPVVRLAFAALAGEPLALAVSTGRRVRRQELGTVPATAVVRRWLPLRDLFALADAAVVHGGAGTTHEALSAGLPLVLLPLGADQPEVARRVAEAGAGIVLDARRTAPGELSAAVREVRADPRYRRAARRLAASAARHGGAAEAADLLVALAAGGGPVVRPNRQPAVRTGTAS